MIVAQAEFIPNESRQNVEAAIVEPPVQEEISQPIPEIDSNTTETPAVKNVDIPAWRAWIDSVAAKFKVTASRPRVEKEAEENVEPVFNNQDFNPINEAAPSDLSSQEIFAEIGLQLKHRRELLSLTHQEIERHTHVRAPFLKALEDGALDALPSLVQTRGILVNYATFLDLDVDKILLRFADGLQTRHRERMGEKPVRKRTMTVNTTLPFWRVLGTTDLLFGGGMAIMLTIFAIWGISFVVSTQSSKQPRATAPSISDVLAASTPLLPPAQEVTLIPVQNTPSSFPLDTTATIASPTLRANITVHVILVAAERTYLRVTVDGKVKFDGRVEPGSAYPFDAEKQIDVLVGNAAALTVTFNGNNLGLMGNFGQVIDNVYTAQGVATPTGTPPPTSTPTPITTPTLTPTVTPTPSKVPTPKTGG